MDLEKVDVFKNAEKIAASFEVRNTNDAVITLSIQMAADARFDLSTRGGRFAEIRSLLKLTGESFAERLNDFAEEAGLERYWTGPKVTNTEKGKRDVSLEDAMIVEHVDPKERGWTWIAFGVPMEEGEDAWAVLARRAKRAKRA